MSLTKDEFWKRVTERLRGNLPEETLGTLNKTELMKLSPPLLKQILQFGIESFIEELRATEKENFLDWMEQEKAPLQQRLEKMGFWYLDYITKIGIPGQSLATFTEQVMTIASLNFDEEIYWDPEIAPKLLILNSINYFNALFPWIRFRPIQDLESFLMQYLALDINWIKAVCALAAEELLVRKALDELNVEHKKIRDFDKLRKMLVERIEEEGKRTGLKVLTIPARRTVRNMVIHEGYNLTEDEAHEIIGDVMQLAKDLSSISKK
jgi:hypothetical protein